ncbi:SRPBCC family protein [Georgenia sp. H159]|uniref:SRPBCC family protein n=1 Tax=Georgenia sp. H159 TaxID=3076115 RepID=UPI002D77E565|nr:SRPBCC family protein [Georgenia sp. H159]
MTEDITTISAGQLDAVERTLSMTEHDDAMTAVATLSQVYDTSVADVWDACTSADRLPRWFLPVSGDLELGGHYQLEGNAGGTVEACDPPSSFRISWEFGGNVSWVTVRVDPAGKDAARLTLEHTAPAALPNDFWQTYGPGATGVGWDLALLGLALHLATGADKPAEGSGWEQSEEARAFIAGSSRRWADASVAAGTPEEQARAAERNTTAFYTGQPTE